MTENDRIDNIKQICSTFKVLQGLSWNATFHEGEPALVIKSIKRKKLRTLKKLMADALLEHVKLYCVEVVNK